MTGPQIFQKRSSHLKTLGVKKDTRGKLHVGDPQTLAPQYKIQAPSICARHVMERTKLHNLWEVKRIPLLTKARTHPRGTTRESTALYLISISSARDALLGCDNDILKLNKDNVLMLMSFPSWLIALTWSHWGFLLQMAVSPCLLCYLTTQSIQRIQWSWSQKTNLTLSSPN